MDSSCQEEQSDLQHSGVNVSCSNVTIGNEEQRLSEKEGLSKNKIRKQRNYLKKLESRKIKRVKEKEAKKSKSSKRISSAKKAEVSQKLREAFERGPKIVIDCHYGEQMSFKEQNRLTQQLRRAYASNKSASNPLHLYFASLPKSGSLYKLCCEKNTGFENYIVDIREENVLEIFPTESIVYLSPDSENVLTDFSQSKVYVIGGLVDETTVKNSSLGFCAENNITTARLPIEEYFKKSGTGTYKKILTVNQMIDIVIEWFKSYDWQVAIEAGLPKRTGLIPK